MSAYPPPTDQGTIFNSSNYTTALNSNITLAEADQRYLKLTGGTVSGTLSANALVSTSLTATDGDITNELEVKTLTPNGTNIITVPNLTGTMALTSQIVDQTSASNLGGGSGIFAQEVANDLQFKSLVAGSNVTLTPNSTEIEISASGGASYPLLAPDGDANDPSYSFSTGSTGSKSGMFLTGSGNIALSTGGSQVLECDSYSMFPSVMISNSQQPCYQLQSDIKQTITPNVNTRLNFNSLTIANNAPFSYGSGTISMSSDTKYEGVYLIVAQIQFSTVSSYQASLQISGVQYAATANLSAANGYTTRVPIVCIQRLLASDTIEVYLQHNNAISFTSPPSTSINDSNWITIFKLS